MTVGVGLEGNEAGGLSCGGTLWASIPWGWERR
ncbi:MAG: hypothetical protein RLZZ282_39 [Verrucomicrobiota bacterium]